MNTDVLDENSSLFSGILGVDSVSAGPSEETVSALGRYVTRVYERNRDHRIFSGIEKELIECLYQADSRYTPEEVQRFAQFNMRPIYFPYTAVKINAAQAWISEIFLNTTEKTYVLRPTPVPELSPEDNAYIVDTCLQSWVKYRGVPDSESSRIDFFYYVLSRRDELNNKISEEARKRAANMEKLISDQFHEGGWRDALADLIQDISTYGTGVLKGPDFRIHKRVRYVKTENGETSCKVESVRVPEWRHLDPFDCYPSPGAVGINDGPFCHKLRILPKDLAAMRGEEGYRDDKINELIKRFPNGGLRLLNPSDSEVRANRNDGGDDTQTCFLEGFEFWGECLGSDLLDWGVLQDLNGDPLDPDSFYEVNAMVFNGEAVYCSLVDERLGRPFYKGTFYSTVGSWWGYGPAKIMRDLQHEMNAAKRNLVYNMAMASGPIKIIDNILRLEDPEAARVTIPWSTVIGKQTLGMPQSSRPLMEFLVTPSIMSELSNELEICMKHADTVTGIPAYSHGSNVAAGAGRTAQGLAMLMDAAQRGIKQVIFNLDKDVMRPAVTYMYRLNLLTSKDPSVKGDCEVDAGGLLAIISRDKNLNLIKEFLVLAQDPAKASVMGEEGIAALMREYARLLQYVNVDDIVPTKEMLEQRRQQQALEQQAMMEQQAAMQQGGAPQIGGGGVQGANPNAMVNPDPARMGQFQPNGIQAQLMEAQPSVGE